MDIIPFHWYFLRQVSNACMIRTTQLFNNFCKICLADTDFELFNSHCFLFLYSFDSSIISDLLSSSVFFTRGVHHQTFRMVFRMIPI